MVDDNPKDSKSGGDEIGAHCQWVAIQYCHRTVTEKSAGRASLRDRQCVSGLAPRKKSCTGAQKLAAKRSEESKRFNLEPFSRTSRLEFPDSGQTAVLCLPII